MTDEKTSPVEIEFTPEFKRSLRALAKKYRNIRSDVQPVIEQIRKGDFVGDQIPKAGDYTIFKVRVRNRDIRKGKSAGYRLVYYVKTEKKDKVVTKNYVDGHLQIGIDSLKQLINKGETVKHLYFDYPKEEA